ncbi:MAG: sulfatase [Myxococcota bacterium]|jgi:arylsulfatase A-like enzyme|nr:sulfatase [Myxococcota bacterium]
MHFRALRETLGFSLLLWIPVLLLEATRPFEVSALIVSPVTRTAFLYSAAIALFIALALGLVAAMMAAADDIGNQIRSGTSGAMTGALVFILVLDPIQRFASDRSLAPHLGSLLAFAVALMVAGLVAWVLSSILLASIRKGAALASSGLAFACWIVLVYSQFAPEPNLAHTSVLAAGWLATAWVLFNASRFDEGGTHRGSFSPLLLAITLPWISMCAVDTHGIRSETEGPRPTAEHPNVLLVIIDTLRADHTDLAGRQVDLTPGIARRAADRGTRFNAAWSAAPNTIPSMKALFTGQLSSHYGGESQIVRRPPLEASTLAETLADAGFETAGITANGLVSGEGFEQGFATYRNVASHDQFIHSFFLNHLLAGKRVYRGFEWMERLEIHKERSDTVTGLAREWVADTRSDREADARPFFLYVHLLDPHWPYHDRGMGAVPPALADLGDPFSHIDFLRLPPPNPDHARYARDTRMQEMQGRYDDEIRASDRDVDQLFAALEAEGVLESTVVVIAGDHGEEFFEHLAFGHGQDVYVEEVHVPLVFLWPADPRYDAMPPEIDEPVSLVDVLPTLVDLFELEQASGAAPLLGQSLLPLLEGKSVERPPLVAESRDARGMRVVWRDGNRVVRFAYTQAGQALTTEDVEVFDQAADPKQQTPLAPTDDSVRGTIERARRDLRARGLR